MPLDIEQLRIFLEHVGYRREHLVENYRFTVRTPDDHLRNREARLVAFSAAPHTMRSACISVVEAPDQAPTASTLADLRYLATPIAIVSKSSTIELCAVTPSDAPQLPLLVAPHTDWPRVFRSRLTELVPDAIIAAKSGSHQLSFAESGLLGWAESIAERTLTSLLEELLTDALRSLPKRFRTNDLAHEAVIRIVFHLFAARVLEDKGLIPSSGTPIESLSAASATFSEAIDPAAIDSPYLAVRTATDVFAALQTRFAFSSLSTELFGHAYENVLVTPKLRKDRGVYYTPRELTRYILNRLPVEALPAEDRIFLDPCCGSGSFLLAGFERLNSLLPTDWSPAQRHQYLRTRLFGSDIDSFATEIATLSLVLSDAYNRNGWKVKTQAVETLSVGMLGRRPSIIGTNPPFGEVKADRHRRERSAEILLKLFAMLPPDGLLGIVLPLSFLDSRASSSARSQIIQHADILEIDILAGRMFHSNADTVALMLRKRKLDLNSRGGVVTVRELRAKDAPAFRNYRGFTRTYSVEPQSWQTGTDYRFVVSPFLDLWSRLRSQYPPLGKLALLRNGLQVHAADHDSVSDVRRDGDVKYIERLDVLRPFAVLTKRDIVPTRWLQYGPNLRRQGDKKVFDEAKVLLNATRNPGSSWRLIAALAPKGLHFSDHFHGVVPLNSEISLEELAAVLNSPVANAWFDSNCRSRKVILAILKDLPFPRFDPGVRDDVRRLVRDLEDAVLNRWQRARGSLFEDVVGDAGEPSELQSKLDRLVHEAYRLSPEEHRGVTKMMSAERRPG